MICLQHVYPCQICDIPKRNLDPQFFENFCCCLNSFCLVFMRRAVYPCIFSCLIGYSRSFSSTGNWLAPASSKFPIASSSSNTGTMRRCSKLGTSPGTELWFENDRLRLYNVMMKPGETVSWESANPLVRWVVGSAEFTETRSDDPEPTKLVLPDKAVRFYHSISGVIWRLCNDGAGPAREIVFELLDDRCAHMLKRVPSSRGPNKRPRAAPQETPAPR